MQRLRRVAGCATILLLAACSGRLEDESSSPPTEPVGSSSEPLTAVNSQIFQESEIAGSLIADEDGVRKNVEPSELVRTYDEPSPVRDADKPPRDDKPLTLQSESERTLEEASKLPPDAWFHLTVGLHDQTPDWPYYRHLQTAAEKEDFLQQRANWIVSQQKGVTAALTAMGATKIFPSKLVNDLRCDIRAKDVPRVLQLPNVRAIAAPAPAYSTMAWTGVELKNALRTQNFYSYSISAEGSPRFVG